MRIFCTVTDRKQLIKALGEKLETKPQYLGAPTFKYQVGPYTILKDGSIEVEDRYADVALLRTLHTEGLVDDSWDKERTVMNISLPLTGHTGQTLTNLAFMLASKEILINKSIRCTGAFHIDESFIEALTEKEAKTIEEYLQIAEAFEKKNSGFKVTAEAITLDGFPASEDPDTVKAYMDLATLMNGQAKLQKRVRPTVTETENEKYLFRVWLVRLGMSGEKYKSTRKILLDNLSGNAAFRTEEQAEAFRAKHRKREVTE